MGFSRQEYWSGLPFPSPGDLPGPGIEPGPAALEADSLPSEPPGKPQVCWFYSTKYFVHIPLFTKTMKESKPSISHHSLSLFTFTHWRRKWQPTPVLLPGESQGWGSLVGFHLWDRTESDMTEATAAAAAADLTLV